MVPKNLHKPGSPKTGLHSWASSTEPPTPISEHSFFLESPKKYKSAAPFFGPPGGPKNWPAKPATFTFPSYPKRRPQKQGRQTDPFLGPQILPSTLYFQSFSFAVSRKTTMTRTVLHRPNHQPPYQSIVFSWKAQKNTNRRPHFLVRLADPKIGPRNLRHLLFPLTQNGGPKNRAARRTHF